MNIMERSLLKSSIPMIGSRIAWSRKESGTVGFEKCFCSCVHGRIWNVVQYFLAALNWLYVKWFSLRNSKLRHKQHVAVHSVLHRTAALSTALSLDLKSLSGSHYATGSLTFNAHVQNKRSNGSELLINGTTCKTIQSQCFQTSVLHTIGPHYYYCKPFRAFPAAQPRPRHFSRMASYCLEVSRSPTLHINAGSAPPDWCFITRIWKQIRIFFRTATTI